MPSLSQPSTVLGLTVLDLLLRFAVPTTIWNASPHFVNMNIEHGRAIDRGGMRSWSHLSTVCGATKVRVSVTAPPWILLVEVGVDADVTCRERNSDAGDERGPRLFQKGRRQTFPSSSTRRACLIGVESAAVSELFAGGTPSSSTSRVCAWDAAGSSRPHMLSTRRGRALLISRPNHDG